MQDVDNCVLCVNGAGCAERTEYVDCHLFIMWCAEYATEVEVFPSLWSVGRTKQLSGTGGGRHQQVFIFLPRVDSLTPSTIVHVRSPGILESTRSSSLYDYPPATSRHAFLFLPTARGGLKKQPSSASSH